MVVWWGERSDGMLYMYLSVVVWAGGKSNEASEMCGCLERKGKRNIHCIREDHTTAHL